MRNLASLLILFALALPLVSACGSPLKPLHGLLSDVEAMQMRERVMKQYTDFLKKREASSSTGAQPNQ